MNAEPKLSDKSTGGHSDLTPADSHAAAPWSANYPSSGEIDLVDIGVLLWSRRWLMLAVFVVLVILTIIAMLLKQPTYEYTTTLELGSLVSQTSGNVVPLMPAPAVASVLQDNYVPKAVDEYVTGNHLDPASVQIPKITVTGDVNSSNVVFSCKAKAALGPVCAAVERTAAAGFIKDNSRFVAAAQNQLTSLQAQAKVLQVQLDKLDASANLYQQQAKTLERQIERMQTAGVDAAKGASSGSAALSNLILNTEVQRASDTLNTVRQQLDVAIPQQRAQLSQQLSDNLHAQQLQQQTITQGYMRTLNAGLRSLKPVGLSRAAVLGIGIVLSIILAIFAAFVATYVGQIRARLAYGTSVKP